MPRVLISVLVAIHLAATVWHGDAHSDLGIELPPEKNAFVYLVILLAPLVAVALLWTRRAAAGFGLLAVAMAGALLFGAYHHYVLVSPDNIAHLPPGTPASHAHFIESAATIALLELAIAIYASFCLGAAIGLRRDLVALLLLAALGAAPAQAQSAASPQPKAQPVPAKVTTIASGLEHPWGLALLPNGELLVTERPGRLRRIGVDGKMSAPLLGVPAVVAKGQGGLLDVTLSPTFATDRVIYLSFSEAGEGGAGTAVARARLGSDALESTQIIWRQQPKVDGPNHWGSRLEFGLDGTLFVTVGDRFVYRQKAQDLSTTLGKVIRINPDGSIPQHNPFVGRTDARPEIWSYGHRNIQAAAVHPVSGELWTVEHGARGGDELNQPQAGKNYGWPVITYGIDYSGAKIGEGTAKAGMEQPAYYWDPVIAPSGATFYRGAAFPQWQGSLLIGSLNPGALVRLTLDGKRVVSEERYRSSARIRDVVEAPDGRIYLITDEANGRVLRLDPKP